MREKLFAFLRYCKSSLKEREVFGTVKERKMQRVDRKSITVQNKHVTTKANLEAVR